MEEGGVSWQIKTPALGDNLYSLAGSLVPQIQEGDVITKLGSTNRPFIFTSNFQTLSNMGQEGERKQNKSPYYFLTWKMSKETLIHD